MKTSVAMAPYLLFLSLGTIQSLIDISLRGRRSKGKEKESELHQTPHAGYIDVSEFYAHVSSCIIVKKTPFPTPFPPFTTPFLEKVV